MFVSHVAKSTNMMFDTEGSYIHSSLIFDDCIIYYIYCCPLPQCQNKSLCRPIVMKKKFTGVFIVMQTKLIFTGNILHEDLFSHRGTK